MRSGAPRHQNRTAETTRTSLYSPISSRMTAKGNTPWSWPAPAATIACSTVTSRIVSSNQLHAFLDCRRRTSSPLSGVSSVQPRLPPPRSLASTGPSRICQSSKLSGQGATVRQHRCHPHSRAMVARDRELETVEIPVVGATRRTATDLRFSNSGRRSGSTGRDVGCGRVARQGVRHENGGCLAAGCAFSFAPLHRAGSGHGSFVMSVPLLRRALRGDGHNPGRARWVPPAPTPAVPCDCSVNWSIQPTNVLRGAVAK